MLPEKRALRKAVEAYKSSVPSTVKSYFNREDCKDIAILTRVISINQKRLFCFMCYSANALECVFFCNRSFECITLNVNPVKWYQSNILALPMFNTYFNGKGYTTAKTYELIGTNGFYSYFNISDRTVTPISYVHDSVLKTKEELMLRRKKENALRKNKEFESRFKKVSKGVVNFAKKQNCFGIFELNNRRKVHCAECGCDFETAEDIKNNASTVCPHCKNKLTCKTERTMPNSFEYGVQYLDKTTYGELCVRHLLCQKRFDRTAKTTDFGFLEYERDEFVNDSQCVFRYYVNRYSCVCDDYIWRAKKPYYGTMISMREICYADEPLYKANLKRLLCNTEYKYSAVEYIDCNFRAEEYLTKYLAVPKIEILVKAGYSGLVLNSESSELKKICERGNTPAAMLGMNKPYRELLKRSNSSYYDANVFNRCFENNISEANAIELIDYFLSKERNFSFNDAYGKMHDFLNTCLRVGCTTHKAVKYLSKQGNSFTLWKDYIENYGALINERWKKRNIFPHRLKKAHDIAYKLYQQRKQKIIEEAIKTVYNGLEATGLDKVTLGNYTCVLPSSQDDFIREGDDLNICVGGGFYAEEYSKSKTIVFFLRNSDDVEKSYCCCEAKIGINDSLYLAQCQLFDHKSAPQNVQNTAKKYVELLSEKLTVQGDKILTKAA